MRPAIAPMAAIVTIAALVLLASPAPADDTSWSRDFAPYGVGWQNTAGTVYAVGHRNGNIYIAGLFDRVGVVPANNIARYDGHQWYALDEGVNGAIYDMEILEQAIYVCGAFNEAGGDPAPGVARWHDSNWYRLGEGEPNGSINCIVYDYGVLYAGGDFTMIGDVVTGRVAGWNNPDWFRVGSNTIQYFGYNYGTVHCLEIYGSTLWAGGEFDHVSPWESNNITFLNEDGAWDVPGTGAGCNGRVDYLKSSGATLWIAGNFSQIENDDSPLLGKANADFNLFAFGGSAPDGEVRGIVPLDFSMVVATEHTVRHHNIHGWNSPFDTLANVMVIDELMQSYVAGGHFLLDSGRGDAVVRWDGEGWRHLGGGLARGLEAHDYLNAFTTYDGDLIAGGYFNLESVSPEEPHCYNVGRYDGRHWLPLDRGFVGSVNDLVVFQGQLYAGGMLESTGGDPVGHLARWDGAAWQPAGGGASVDGEVLDLVKHDGLLVIGGSFNAAGGVTCDDLVTWDGASFATLGLGQMTGGTITAMVSHDGDLYVAGYFSALDGVPANRVARWDGATWHALGEGLDGQTMALASYGGQLWAGRRHYAPDEAVTVLSRWDGAAWHDAATAIGSEYMTEVDALLATSDGLVAGGAFHTIGGVAAGNIAVWDGAAWEAYGTGVSGGHWHTGVHVLHVHEDQLYLGGDFTHAGSYVSTSIARWNETMTPVFLQQFDAVANADNPTVRLDWRAAVQGAPAQFQLAAIREGESDRTVAYESTDSNAWFAIDDHPSLACGGEVTYRLAVRQGDENWDEVGRQTVRMRPAAGWLRPRLAVAPNPANPRTTIELWLPRAGEVQLAVYDVRGRQVARLLTGVQPAGRVEVPWNGRDDRGRDMASGVYLVQVRSEDGVANRRVALVR